MSTRLTFGKYGGMTFKEAYESDHSYASWVVGQPNPVGNFKEFAEYCRLRLSGACTPRRGTKRHGSDFDPDEAPDFGGDLTPAKRQKLGAGPKTRIEGKVAKRLSWHLTRGGTFRKVRDEKGAKMILESVRALSDVETHYIERLKLLGKVNSEGILDDEIRDTPDAFKPKDMDGTPMRGPLKCGPNAMPHNVGRWFFKPEGGGDILWADGTEPFSESNQRRFRQAFDGSGAMVSDYAKRGYCVEDTGGFGGILGDFFGDLY